MTDNGELTPKQQRFCEEYIIDLNAAQAAIRAGYGEKSARSKASQLLTKVNIQNEVQRLKAKRSKRVQLDADDIVQELMRVGYSNIRDYLTVDEDGEVYIKNFDDIDRDKLAAVESVKVNVTKNKDESREYKTTQFKLHNKLTALDQLCRHLGLFKADSLQRTEQVEDFTPEQRKRLKHLAGLADGLDNKRGLTESPPDTTKNVSLESEISGEQR